MLAGTGSRNAAYLAEQALEQCIRAVATSEAIHIERHDAHQLDKIVRRFPAENPLTDSIRQLTWLEAYATVFRYPTATGRIAPAPPIAKVSVALDRIESMLARLVGHFGVDLVRENQPAEFAGPIR